MGTPQGGVGWSHTARFRSRGDVPRLAAGGEGDQHYSGERMYLSVALSIGASSRVLGGFP